MPHYGGAVYDDKGVKTGTYEYDFVCKVAYPDGTVCENIAKSNGGTLECPIHGREKLRIVTYEHPLPESERTKTELKQSSVLEEFRRRK